MYAELSRERRAELHAALGDRHRLGIVDELVVSERAPSELSSLLGLAPNLLAHHLDVLEDAGLVERIESAGDRRRRYVRLLPDALPVVTEPVDPFLARRVLFVCRANSARSQLAAAAWNARHDVPASSAGTQPAERVRSEAIAAAARAGLDLRKARTRSIDDLAEAPDLVVTVCDVAREELGALRSATLLHWSIPDPVIAATPEAYDGALDRIRGRVDILAPHVRPSRRPRRSRP